MLRITTFLLLLLTVAPTFGNGPRVLTEGRKLSDVRQKPLKDLNGYFPFKVPSTKKDWDKRSAEVRRRLLVTLGLWPMPRKTELEPVIHSKREFDGYSIEKVYFESFPGFYVTGSLYRPLGKLSSKSVPAVLCPHGHWRNGRFYDASNIIDSEIKSGAEKRRNNARSPLQARCVHLARMGCVVFHYDMIGYADSIQISYERAHRMVKQTKSLNHPERWGLFSPQAESRFQSVMGLQTYNSIRALDFVESLPEVDPKRLGVTGASGGGTQTFILAAIDPRPAVAMPAVMVSTAMQGGCTCENASGLRVGTGNVEFAALFAPKPLGLTAADDWTKEMTSKGFPELQKLYALAGAADNVTLASHIQFGHNYNLVCRNAMYRWFNKHLNLGHKGAIVEKDFIYQNGSQLTVWDDQHPRPTGGNEFEISLLKYWNEDAQKQLKAATPKDAKSLLKYKVLAGSGIDTVIGRGLPDPKAVAFERTTKSDEGKHLLIGGLLQNNAAKEEVPIMFAYPKQWDQRVTIWLSEKGKDGIFQQGKQLKPAVKKLVNAGVAVVSIDLLFQGEFDNAYTKQTRRVKNEREFAGYTFGYNSTLLARRVHDVLNLISYVRNHEYTPEKVSLVALDGTAAIAVAARAQARDAVHELAINLNGFRFGDVQDWRSPQFLAGGAKYNDVLGMLAVAAPESAWVGGETSEASALPAASYKAAGEGNALKWQKNEINAGEVATWILR